MRSRFRAPRAFTVATLVLAACVFVAADAYAQPNGLNPKAKKELSDAGVDKYLGAFTPVSSEPFNQDWTKHTFDTEGGDGPTCIDNTEYSVFTKPGRSDQLLIFLQGGGACWQSFPQCNRTAESQFPPPAAVLPGIFSKTSQDGMIPNDIGNWSVLYLPYCDGSVFGGDNSVADPTAPTGTRHHRGLRNLSAGMDVARAEFGKPEKILIAGSSAGGVGTAAFAPFLARFLFGNNAELFVFNDAGPIALNPDGAPAAAAARAEDWGFAQFYPQSCIDEGLCDPAGQQTGIVEWRLENDSSIREAFYETDGDLTNIGFASANIPDFSLPFVPLSQTDYRGILDAEHGALNAAYPDRYRRFIVSGGNPICFGYVVYSHTALQGGNLGSFGCPGVDLFYQLEVNGIPLHQWTNDFVKRPGGDGDWMDNVASFQPGPPLP